MHRGPARFAHQQALLPGDAAGGEHRVAVGDRDPAVYDLWVEALGHEVLADALGEIGKGLVACVERAFGIRADHDYGTLALLEIAGGSCDRSAGAHTCNEVSYATFGLLPDLGPGGLVVRARVLLIAVLVRLEGAGDLFGEAFGHSVIGLGGLGWNCGGGD